MLGQTPSQMRDLLAADYPQYNFYAHSNIFHLTKSDAIRRPKKGSWTLHVGYWDNNEDIDGIFNSQNVYVIECDPALYKK